ncbi:ABC transporter substrate-binding protein [Beggiatoa leptomitoformis]|uniref:ABC transporter substrate-binding protein n=1 Tax=Beggiatoa leptomitoformis TaxID=288004 RepID=A0A2N9YC84_9GAMM|nr:ABC transporter substrate binding protein [Beggiatoa leptomitoformis]ALG66657.1 ABC transporter substrate-binding protein [Beggiatoa leptomitoformis]AUI68024.1 ABC transporter substrate-binding protein [Beggiatoa leptomitoformis]
MSKFIRYLFFTALIIMPFMSYAENNATKKILYIDSYYEGYEWSDGVVNGVRNVLAKKMPTATLKTIYMDSNRHSELDLIQAVVAKIRDEITNFQPDVVIACDDSAMKNVVMPYYKNTSLPIVFCGINWDASIYGLPYQNTTGMVEVSLIPQIVAHLEQYAKGKKLGILAEETISSQKNIDQYKKMFHIQYDKVYKVSTIGEWKEKFLQLQDEVDMILMTNMSNVRGWNETEVADFVYQNIKIPLGTDVTWNIPYSLVAIGKIPEEQGEWAAETALKILAGEKPSEIPITQNKQGQLHINLKLGNKLKIAFNPALLKVAELFR